MSAKTRNGRAGTTSEWSGHAPRYTESALAFVSQGIHLWVLQEQFLFRPLTGGLIFLAAVCQGLLAASLLFGPGRWMVRFGVALNVCVVTSWAVTRFFGYPGLLGFDRLPVEPLNLTAAVAEAGLIVLLIRIRRQIKPHPESSERRDIVNAA